MNRSTIEILKRVKTHCTVESKRMTLRGRPKRACMFARWALSIGDAIAANKELMVLKNEKVTWK